MYLLTLCILMDVPIHIDPISRGLPILYFKGLQVELSELLCINVPGKMQVSMIRKYHNHTLQTNPRHREEEPYDNGNHKTTRRLTK